MLTHSDAPPPPHTHTHTRQVYAVADNPRFECDQKPILFKPTMMFQTRSFTFPLVNTSSSSFDYK